MATKRYALPKRFNAALSEKAYKQLRALNETYRYGNNYLLTIILENFPSITDAESVEAAFAEFEAKYGAPAAGNMQKRR